jgi:hypothetical protein
LSRILTEIVQLYRHSQKLNFAERPPLPASKKFPFQTTAHNLNELNTSPVAMHCDNSSPNGLPFKPESIPISNQTLLQSTKPEPSKKLKQKNN